MSKFGPLKILLISLSWIKFRAAGFDKPRTAARRCDEVNRIGNVQPSTNRTSHPSCRKWANCWACWPGTTPPPAARRRSTTSTWTLKVRYLHVFILLQLEICFYWVRFGSGNFYDEFLCVRRGYSTHILWSHVTQTLRLNLIITRSDESTLFPRIFRPYLLLCSI